MEVQMKQKCGTEFFRAEKRHALLVIDAC